MWLGNAQGNEDGMLFPARPTRSAVALRLGPDQVELQAHGTAVKLAWEENDRSWTVDPWRGTFWPTTMSGGDWTAIHAKGEGVNVIAPILMALAASSRRFTSRNPIRHALDHGPVVPLHRPWTRSTYGLWAERATIWALLRLLASRPKLRPRLLDQARAVRLGRDMEANKLGYVAPDAGVRRSTTEIVTAMTKAHVVHPLGGRPIPGDPLIPRNEAIDSVMHRLAENPFAKGVNVDAATVSAQLDNRYYRVEPWPFRSLVEDAAHRQGSNLG